MHPHLLHRHDPGHLVRHPLQHVRAARITPHGLGQLRPFCRHALLAALAAPGGAVIDDPVLLEELLDLLDGQLTWQPRGDLVAVQGARVGRVTKGESSNTGLIPVIEIWLPVTFNKCMVFTPGSGHRDGP